MLDNYGAQDPSDLSAAATRSENAEIMKDIVKRMKKYKPLMALDKDGIIKEAYYKETERGSLIETPAFLSLFRIVIAVTLY